MSKREPQRTGDKQMTGRLNAIEGTSQGLELVSGKWTILIIFELKRGVCRLSDLQRKIQGISQKMWFLHSFGETVFACF